MNLAIFASGNGSNFTAIVKAVRGGMIKAGRLILVCDNPRAFVLKRAQKAGIPIVLVSRRDFSCRRDFERAITQRLVYYKIDLVVLAGFMRMLSPAFVREYRSRILNIHPSLLPDFKGAHAIKDAFEKKVAFTGVTVHFVDSEMDHGPVILQEKIAIRKKESLACLEKRIHNLEHRLYPQVVKLFCEGKMRKQK